MLAYAAKNDLLVQVYVQVLTSSWNKWTSKKIHTVFFGINKKYGINEVAK